MPDSEHNWAVLSQPSLQWTKQFKPEDRLLAKSNAPNRIRKMYSYHFDYANPAWKFVGGVGGVRGVGGLKTV
jgi:hypothetical protein